MVGITIRKELLAFIAIAIWFIVLLFKYFKKKKLNLKHEFFIFIVMIYVLWVVGITLFPIDITWVKEYIPKRNVVISLNPFNLIEIFKLSGFKFIIINVLGNIALLIPSGILISYKKKSFSYMDAFKIGLLITISIEIMQGIEMYFSLAFGRSIDINDIIFNILGILIGKFIYDNLLINFIDKKLTHLNN